MTTRQIHAHFWAHAHAPFPPGIHAYNPSINYVGPQRWISNIVPRYIYTVDVNTAAYAHDWRYAIPGTRTDRRIADKQFHAEILMLIANAKLPLIIHALARIRARTYYIAVRAIGWRYYGTPSTTRTGDHE